MAPGKDSVVIYVNACSVKGTDGQPGAVPGEACVVAWVPSLAGLDLPHFRLPGANVPAFVFCRFAALPLLAELCSVDSRGAAVPT